MSNPYNNNWAYYQTFYANKSQVPGNIVDFRGVIDLSSGLVPDHFWENVKDDGGDIRMTTGDGATEIPIEVVSFSKTLRRGRVFFKLTSLLSSTVDTPVVMYYGNPDADLYDRGDTYGKEAVWEGYLLSMHGAGDATDSSPQENNGALFDVDQNDEYFDFLGEQLIHDALSGSSALAFGKSTGNQQIAYSFVLTEAIAARLDIMVTKAANTGSPTDAATFGIQADVGGEPSGSNLVSANANWNGTGAIAVGTDFLWFTVSGSALVVGNTYWLVGRRVGSLSDVNYPNISYDPAGTSGTLKVYDGAVWNTVAGSLRTRLYKSGYVDLDSTVTLTKDDAIMSAMFQRDTADYECLYSSTVSSTGHIEFNGAGGTIVSNPRVVNYRPSSGTARSITSSINFNDSDTHQIIWRMRSGGQDLFIDGMLQGSTVAQDGSNPINFIGSIQSRVNSNYSRALTGRFWSLRLYRANTTSNDRILAEYRNERAPTTFFYRVVNIFAEGFDDLPLYRKSYQYKIYSKEGVYLKTWTDVVNDPSFEVVINGGAVELQMKLARKTEDFGEGVDVAFMNEVQLWCFDADTPNGIKIFSGYISRYDPRNDGTLEYIMVYALGYHTRLKDFIYELPSGATVISHPSKDPGEMAEDVIDKVSPLGLPISWTEATLQKTGTVASYIFNTANCQEAIDKILELCPFGWYWYVDPEKRLNIHPKKDEPDHTFSIGKELFYVEPQKRIENIVNRIYFIGGDVNGAPLYKRYERQASIQNYGVHAIKKIDQRITIEATMDTVAENILDARQEAEIRMIVRIKDNDFDRENGYNIESIQIGDTCQIRNYQDSFAGSIWDVSLWDSFFWDFDVRNITETVMQIVGIQYQPNYIELVVSSKIPDVSKRVEDINRNLVDSLTNDNPTNPGLGNV